jgi:hypothetical protein
MIADQVATLLNHDGHFEPAAIIKDLAGHKRVVAARAK